MQGVKEDFTNKVFGTFTVMEFSHIAKSGHQIWKCKCSCNREKFFSSSTLNGNKTSCDFCFPRVIREKKPRQRKQFDRKFKDYTGEKINSFIVIKRERISDAHPTWLCKCENCGSEVIRGSERLAKRTPICKFCKELNRKTQYAPRVRKDKNQCAVNRTYSIYKRSGIKRGFEFLLSEEEFYRLSKLDCYYCGEPPSNKTTINFGGENIYNGLG